MGRTKALDREVNMAPLSGYVGFVLRRAQWAIFTDFNDSLAELDLRPGQFDVLVMIDQNPATSQSHVSDALGIQKANFVTTIAELELRGLISRCRSPTDARTYELRLTGEGRTVLRRAQELQAVHEERVCAQLKPAERQQLLALLEKLNAKR